MISIEELDRGRSYYGCAGHIATIEPTRRRMLLGELAYERLSRKQHDILEVLRMTNNDWNETLHIMLFRFLGGSHNRVAAERLAHIINSHMIMRENSSLRNVEALLLGGSGLLSLYGDDEYVITLRREFDHYAAKYDIMPMLPGEWQLTGMYINNHPVLRLAQLASCLHEGRITMSSVTECRTRRDVVNLFSGRASNYWIHNFMPGSEPLVSSRIGQFKSDIMGINLIVPIAYTYGNLLDSEVLVERALSLLDDIPSESNRYTKMWNSHDTISHSAFDSQALLQLSREYCERGRCSECYLAKLLIALSKQDVR